MQKSNNITVLGVSGYARCGKNTFVEIAKNILTKNNYSVIELAFANKLKTEVQEMLRRNGFKLDIFGMTPEQKEHVRPLFVFWGCQRRYESEGGMYWVNEVDNQLRNIIIDAQRGGVSTDRMVVLISDCRFPNEIEWVQKKWSGQVIHLKKWRSEWRKSGQDGSDLSMMKVYDSAPNEEEAKQDPIIEAMADFKIEWEGTGKLSILDASIETDLQEVVLETLNSTKFFRHKSNGILTL